MKKSNLLILLIVLVELGTYVWQFVVIKNEAIFQPETKVGLNFTREQKINVLNGIKDLPLNSGVMLNSEILNGYDPILPKRVLWIVNAIEGREMNHIETVSLNVTKFGNPLYRLAGVTENLVNNVISSESAVSRIFYKTEIVDDQKLYELIKSNQLSMDKTLIIARSDELLAQNVNSLPACDTLPEVKIMELTLWVKASCEFYYVFPMGYSEGWVAEGNDKFIPAVPGFRFLQVYHLPAGEYELGLTYRPVWWRKLMDPFRTNDRGY